jgi:sensor c-di-GMP phosphodiesterase-like protein
LAVGQSDALLIKSTVDLAHALGLKVVAEGVETAEAAAILQTMGCDTAQGYYFARPMARDAVIDLLAEYRPPDIAARRFARTGGAWGFHSPPVPYGLATGRRAIA